MTHPSPNTDWLARAAASAPAAIALVEPDGTEITYAELHELADRAASQLHREFGLEPAGIMGFAPQRVRADIVAAVWGTWRLGAAAMIADPHAKMFRDGAGVAQRRWGVPAFLQGLDIGEGAPPAVAVPGPDQLHTVVLTSGGSRGGRPVRLTHGNIAAAVNSSAARLGNTAEDRWLLTLPLFHIGGLSILWRSAAATGTVVMHDGFDAERVARAMKHGSVTIASLVPTMLYRILAAEPGPYRGMRAVLLGGAAADHILVERALDAGLPILQTYGMTEACSQVATVDPGQARESLGTAGRPLAGMKVTIDGGADIGEIVIDGPAVFPGYLDEPDRSGGHRTGDIGWLDGAGRLVVLGRVDDMVVTGGENVFPSQVAEILAEHPLIDEVEIVGVPDPEWGQALVAVIVGDAPTRQQIERWARERLARHQVPKRWVFVDGLPLQANGKVSRSAIRKLATGER